VKPSALHISALHAAAHGAALMACVVLGTGCATDEGSVRLGDATVLYEGEPYGDFVALADDVRECMHSDKPGLPRLVLVDSMVECFTENGWQWVLGCEGAGRIYVVAPMVSKSKGALWSHELSHYYGAASESHVCGMLQLENFSLDVQDGGP
jgi:hypothetical protein